MYRETRSAGPPLWVAVAVPSGYFAAATFAIHLSGQSDNIASLWPAGAILVAALLRQPVAAWPVLLALSAGANVAANMYMGTRLAVALGLAGANMIEPLLIAATIKRYGEDKPWFISARWMALFAGSSALASGLAAALGSAWLALLAGAPFAATWKVWLVADLLGLVTVTPFLLSWTEPFLRGQLTLARSAEAVVLTCLTVGVAFYAFSDDLPLLFLVFPCLMLATLRTGLPGATAGAVALAGIAMWFTLQGQGPIAALHNLNATARIQSMQLYIFATLLTTLPIAVILAHRELLAAKLRERDIVNGAALQNMLHGLSMFDTSNRLLVCNERFADIYDLPANLAQTGTALADILEYCRTTSLGRQFSGESMRNIHAAVKSRRATSFTFEMANGRIVSVALEPIPEGGYVVTHDDITERRRTEAEIAHMARHDALTDLPNRVLLHEYLRDAFATTKRKGESFALLCLDLDRFKAVNDTLGHPAGDELLRQVARRLRACSREIDCVARLGGDEFAVLQKCPDQPRDATALARRIVAEISEPYDLDGRQVVVGVSIGVAIAPNDGREPDLLFKNADLALYRAKRDGKGLYRFFEPGMDAQAQARRSLELDLRNALAKGEIELHYQPLVALSPDRVSGFEALMRWRHPVRGPVPPAEFIPLAEEVGLIGSLGEWTLRQACSDAVGWPEDVRVAVNLSPAQFSPGNDLADLVNQALEASSLAPSRLELEITESVLLDESATTLATLHRLRSLGVRISLDDFGTGYSSLSYLRKFPFDKIKIDRSFVRDLGCRSESRAIVQAVVNLANALGMATTAEGVETQEQLDELRREGCTEVQGFLFSPARPLAQTKRLVESCRREALAAA